jgi:hypothetical protein
MIESGTEIEQAVANDNAQIVGRLWAQPDSQDSQSIRLLLRNNLALAMFEPLENFDYVPKVFLCPDQFELRAVERMGHAT